MRAGRAASAAAVVATRARFGAGLAALAVVGCGGITVVDRPPETAGGSQPTEAATSPPRPDVPTPEWEWAPSTVATGHPRALPPRIDVDHYDIELRVDHEALAFSGRVTMRAEVIGEPTTCVAIHLDPSVEVGEVLLTDDVGESVVVPTVEREGDVLRACVEAPLVAGYAFRLQTVFSGTAGERDHYGLFVARSDTSELPSFYTQFESQGARLALPLVDEPYDKATTTVALTGHERYTLLSNGDPTGCEEAEPSWKTCTWDNPDPISPYLITFVAAELEQIESSYERSDGNRVPLTVYTEPGRVSDGLYAMYALERCLATFEAAYRLPFPWSRYGIVALPGFRYGGMENKGLTNIAASALYVDPGTTPLSRRYSSFGITAHELAHEWFGNLVTMQWWDDVWLNEGFASYMTRLATSEEFDPVASQLWDHAGLQRWYMDVERGPFAHPIVYEEWTTPEQLFDAISYTKGRKVLEMLEVLVGRDTLFAGIRRYLTENAGSNAATDRFFATVEAEHGEPLDGFVRPWLFEAGFPEVTFSSEWIAAVDTLALTVSQRSSQGDEHGTVWTFPLRVGFEGPGYAVERWYTVDQPEQTFRVALPGPPDVVSPNRGGTALIDVVVEGFGHADWRAQALSDGDAFGRGVATYEMLEDLGEAWELDPDATRPALAESAEVFRAAMVADPEESGARALRAFALSRLDDTELPSEMLDALCLALRDPLLTYLEGPEPTDDVLEVDARKAAIAALGRVDEPEVHALLRELSTRRVDYVGPAVGALLASSDPGRFDAFDGALRSWADNRPIVRELSRALASTDDPAVLDMLRAHLSDPRYAAPGDHQVARSVLGGLVGDNADLAYTEAGLAFVLEVFERELDRPGTLIRTLRRFQDAAERSEQEQARLAAMLDRLSAILAETGDPEQVGEVVRMLRDSLRVE